VEEKQKRARGRPRAFNDQSENKTVRALDRGIAVLAALAEGDGVSLTELAERAGEPVSTVYRALSTLQNHEVVEFEETTQLWFIGAGAFRIGSVFLKRTNILERSRPVMRALMRDTGETANLGIERGDRVLFISQAESRQTIRAFFPPGTRNLMHASGIGKALLAAFPQEQVDRIVREQGLERFTDTTITDPDDLRRELETVRRKGYAVDNEERTEGMRCIASVIHDANGDPVAGVSISGPAFRIPPNATSALGERVRTAAAEISKNMGG